MRTKLIRSRVVTGCLMTFLAPFGAVVATTAPAVESSTPSPVRSVDRYALPLGPLTWSDADAPWLYKNLIAFPPAQLCPLKPFHDAQPAEPTTEAQRALPEVQPPGIVQNLRRVE